ncbi:hypothetical protein L596_021108 [Steinernema carpocapsae]|uniref:Uncharacterized protein n=1 Tax=Steinernema carpocapsae TaxID=34508 RepID=A0A4U5MVK7_STECR|nr:hypothetical protein L596_021108 [Steinernema carpocapsae]
MGSKFSSHWCEEAQRTRGKYRTDALTKSFFLTMEQAVNFPIPNAHIKNKILCKKPLSIRLQNQLTVGQMHFHFKDNRK